MHIKRDINFWGKAFSRGIGYQKEQQKNIVE